MEKWYCKLNLAQPVQKRADSKSRSHLWKNSPRLDWLSQIKLIIPLFHPEFDALQLLFDGLVKIPPFGNIVNFAIWLFYGDFGDFSPGSNQIISKLGSF